MSTLKRKVDGDEDQSARVRDFRRELNANSRLGMPAPTLPIPPPSRQSSQMQQRDRPAQPFMFGDYPRDNVFPKEQHYRRSNDEDRRPPETPRQNFSHQGQHYQRPPQTPQQSFFSRTDIPQTAVGSNPPFRNPFPGTRSYTSATPQLDNRSSYLSPPTSLLASHFSDHRYAPAQRSQTTLGSSGASPFFSRPSSVVGRLGGDGNMFSGEYLQRPQSSRPNASRVSGGQGGLGGLLEDSPKERRVYR
jgi:hypothetical protein